MKQSSKFEIDLLNAVNKLQEQLIALEKKIDNLINRPSVEAKPVVKLPTPQAQVNNKPNIANNPQHKERVLYKAICADCQKECSIPFKPSGDRPVYCKDCFSRRKMISMSGVSLPDKPKETPLLQATTVKEADVKKSAVKSKKKVAVVKKSVAKKKTAPKKK